MSAAEVRVSGRVFYADECHIEAGVVHARGRWRRRTGPNYSVLAYGEPRSYSWPIHAVDEILWTSEVAA